jgi:hypothetical protein
LEGGPPIFRQDCTCPALLKDPDDTVAYGAVTRSGRPFQTVLLASSRPLACSAFARHYSRNLAGPIEQVRWGPLLMSVPPGTEMFQFPGFASTDYEFIGRYPKGVGCPIRTSTDQRLLAAPHGFSQRATSFIASWCQGIHRMPFLCSRSSGPIAKHEVSQTKPSHHAQEPSILDRGQWPVIRGQEKNPRP